MPENRITLTTKSSMLPAFLREICPEVQKDELEYIMTIYAKLIEIYSHDERTHKFDEMFQAEPMYHVKKLLIWTYIWSLDMIDIEINKMSGQGYFTPREVMRIKYEEETDKRSVILRKKVEHNVKKKDSKKESQEARSSSN